MHKAVAIIPARFNSLRFPGKPLAVLNGKTIIERVFEKVSSANLIDSVFIATDDKRIYNAVLTFGGKAIITSSSHTCGTERIAEAARNIECDIIINVQSDEPFIEPEMVNDTITLLIEDDEASMSTLAVKISSREDMVSPHIVKVVTDDRGYALYFSRSPIPYYRDYWNGMDNIEYIADKTTVLKHIGIYGYRKKALMNFISMQRGLLEDIEKLEQLRALAAGMKIKVKETKYDTLGIDTIDDLKKAENLLK